MFAVLKDKWTKLPGRTALFLLIVLVLPGAATAQVSASPSQLLFGPVPLGGTSAAQSIRLTNSGPAAVYVTYPAITGVFVSDFSVSTDCPMFNAALTQIEAGASCNFSLEFVPTAMGPETATATFSIYDSSFQTIGTATVGLSGTATLPISPSPAQLNFGYSIENSTSVSLPLTVTNSGSIPLTFGATVTNPDFGVDFSPCHNGPLALGASCVINVLFRPTITGPDSGELVLLAINTVGQPLAQVSVPLAGFGHPLDVNFADFGIQLSGGVYQAPLRIFNTSFASVNINAATLSGLGFAKDDGCIGTLAAQSLCIVTVAFTPTSNVAYSGTLTIFDDDPTSPQVVQLSGAGSAAVVSPSFLGYPVQPVGVPSSQTVTLTNPTAGPLAVGRISASGDYNQKNDCGRSLGPDSSCSIIVTFSPTDLGLREGMLVLNEIDPSSPQSVRLAGYGVAPMKHVHVHYDYMVLPDQGTACTPRNAYPGDVFSPDCARSQSCVDNVCRGHSHAPDDRAIDAVIEAFRQHGSVLHIDPNHTAIPERTTIEFGQRGHECAHVVDPVNFYDLRDQYYQPSHKFEHYAIFGHFAVNADSEDCLTGRLVSGFAEIPPFDLGQNFVVALGGFLDVNAASDARLRFEAGTFMHELGHNLGLQHGGGLFGEGDDTNYKPNYISVMNYYNQGGILQADAVGSEQIKSCSRDKDCGPAALCTQSPGGAFNGVPYPAKFCTRYDYSDQLLPAGGPTPGVLNEIGQLSEPAGLGSGRPDLFIYSDANCLQRRAPSDGPVDWDGDGDTTGTGLTVDLDFIWWESVLGIGTCPSGRYIPLRGHNDWGDLFALQERPHTDHSWKSNPEPHREHELTIGEAKEKHILHLPRQVTIMAESQCSLASAVAAKSSDITLWLPGTDDLDVTEIDIDSLKLHGVSPAKVSVVDVNGDGRPDLVLTFPTASLKLHPNAKRMTLTGSLKNSQAFWGHVEVSCQESFRIER